MVIRPAMGLFIVVVVFFAGALTHAAISSPETTNWGAYDLENGGTKIRIDYARSRSILVINQERKDALSEFPADIPDYANAYVVYTRKDGERVTIDPEEPGHDESATFVRIDRRRQPITTTFGRMSVVEYALQTTDAYAQVVEFYKKQMVEQGWTINVISETTVPENVPGGDLGIHLSGNKDNGQRRVGIMIGRQGSRTNIKCVFLYPQETPRKPIP